MKRKELRAQARVWLDDIVAPGLWKDDDLNRYANEAVREACIRARLLVDSHSTITQIPVVANQPSYSLHKKIIFARRVAFVDATGQRERALCRATSDMLDNHHDYGFRAISAGNWKMWRSQWPHYVVQDLEERQLRLVGIPTATGTIKLTVVRYPLDCEEMDTESSEPVIGEEYHIPLAHWICYRAFDHKDDELYDPARSNEHYEKFEAVFGPKPSAKEIRAMAHDQGGEIVGYDF